MNVEKNKKPARPPRKQPPRGLREKPGGGAIAARGLRELRVALLDLHKALVDSERANYEKSTGVIQSPNHFLQLLIRDPWFAWLRPLSQLIVAMDEALDEEEPPTTVGVDSLVKQTRLLLTASETGEGFSKHYFDALQRDPGVVLAHAKTTTLLGPRNRVQDRNAS
jgi:hypothetical protein